MSKSMASSLRIALSSEDMPLTASRSEPESNPSKSEGKEFLTAATVSLKAFSIGFDSPDKPVLLPKTHDFLRQHCDSKHIYLMNFTACTLCFIVVSKSQVTGQIFGKDIIHTPGTAHKLC